jgi:pimeloyl-ACP methyl ester carboxylesterase
VAPGVDRSERAVPGLGKAYLYAPKGRAPAGAYLVTQGLHYLGPDDARLDRFCRALAASGILVLTPFLPELCRLRLSPRTTDDLAAAFDELERAAALAGLARPAVFTISFGSQPGIELAARPSHQGRLRALVVFGGFADFPATVRFALTGVVERGGVRFDLPHDPLNNPAIFVNMLPHLQVEGDRSLLEAAWMTMAIRTWSRADLKPPGKRDPHAHAIAETLPADLREMFLLGCGLRPGTADRFEEVLRRHGDDFAFCDPQRYLAEVRAPVYVIHGRGDDVIPWFEAEKIRDGLPEGTLRRFLISGMASHTGAQAPPSELVKELRVMIDTLRAIHEAPRLR